MHMLYAAPSQNLAQHLMIKPTSKMVQTSNTYN